MKPDQAPLAKLPKPKQRRQLAKDIKRYQRQGGKIQSLADGTARGLCSIDRDDIEMVNGYLREI